MSTGKDFSNKNRRHDRMILQQDDALRLFEGRPERRRDVQRNSQETDSPQVLHFGMKRIVTLIPTCMPASIHSCLFLFMSPALINRCSF